MTVVRNLIARLPLTSFLLIAFGFSWAFTALLQVSVAFGLIALFGPAVAAFVVSRADGRMGELRERFRWRQPAAWYVAALAIPFAVAAAARVIHLLLGGSALGFGTVSAIELAIFVLVIGEEIGWRGFLQPRLQERFSVTQAGLLTGAAWTAWHLPLYVQAANGPVAFLVFACWVIPLALVMGHVANRTRFSILVATVLHGSANIAGPILLPDLDRQWILLMTGAFYLLTAGVLVLTAGRARTVSETRPAPA